MHSYMFDTNVFNAILDKNIDISSCPRNWRYYVTHVQLNELQNTRNSDRREKLLGMFYEIPQEFVPTESGIWGTSEWGECKWSGNNNRYDQIVARLNKMNGGKRSNGTDALIAETAIQNDCILVTNDKDLATVVKEFGGKVISTEEFLRECRR